MTLTFLSLPHCWYVAFFITIIHQHNVNQMTWCWQSEISLLLNANKGGKLHKLDAIFVPSDGIKTIFLETIWRNVQKNENKLSLQRSCHYQTTEHCLATDNNRSTSSWKETNKSNLTLVSFMLFLNYYDCKLK